jgi:hypothetical protein
MIGSGEAQKSLHISSWSGQRHIPSRLDVVLIGCILYDWTIVLNHILTLITSILRREIAFSVETSASPCKCTGCHKSKHCNINCSRLMDLYTDWQLHMLMVCHHTAGSNQECRYQSRSFENVSKFWCFEQAVIKQNSVKKETKIRLNWLNDLEHSVQNLSSSSVEK